MTEDKIAAVLTEMRRMLLACEALRDARNIDPTYEHRREQGTVRRASMCLTNALVDLRKPG